MRRDAALVSTALALCPLVAAVAPSEPPLERTRVLIDAERALGLFVEPAVHAWVAERPALMTAATLFYVWVHLPATIGALVWARLERPYAFPRARDTLLVTQLVTVAGYLTVPVAPPRMVPELGFADPLSAGAQELAHTVQSPYAAMPSGHVAFALVAAGVVFGLVRTPAIRAAALLYPTLVVAVIIVTANHLWLDAAGGIAAAALGWILARRIHRRGGARTRERWC